MSDVEAHVVNALTSAHKNRDPFPYFFAKNVFPQPFYDKMMEILAQKDDYHAEAFANRKFADDIGLPGLEFMKSTPFFHSMLRNWPIQLSEKFGGRNVQFYHDLRLIRDQQHYKIGPHTDAPWKVLSLLFYLPATDEHSAHGTSFYAPHNRDFVCAGGPHHKFELFDKVATMPFLPNTCLGFWKTNKSFHGVEPIPVQFQRNVLLYNIYCKDGALPIVGGM